MNLKISKIFKLSSKLNPPTSYLPSMIWLIKWITRSHAVPIMLENNSLSIIKGFNPASAIHYFTLFLTNLYPFVSCVWLYLYFFPDKATYSRAPQFMQRFSTFTTLLVTLRSVHFNICCTSAPQN